MHESVKRAADSGDVKTLKYIFRDCLDGDPTFEKYQEDYSYCVSKGLLFVPHVELTPMTLDNVNDVYWVQLKNDFMENPSKERLEHMKQAAKIFYKDSIDKINAKKAAELEAQKRAAEFERQQKAREEAERQAQQRAVEAQRQAQQNTAASYNQQTSQNQYRTQSAPVQPQNTGNEGKIYSQPVSSGNENDPKKANGAAPLLVLALIIAAIIIIAIIASK